WTWMLSSKRGFIVTPSMTCRCWSASAIPLPPIPAPRWSKSPANVAGPPCGCSTNCTTQSHKTPMKGTIKTLVNRLFTPARGPLRLTREKHGIDKRKVSRHAIKVCEVLNQHGYDAYIVGGAVRDLIVGLAPKDFDVATNATPNQIRPLFRRARIIGRRFQLVHVVFGQEIIETSTFRAPASEEQETDEHGRILRDNEFGTHEED